MSKVENFYSIKFSLPNKTGQPKTKQNTQKNKQKNLRDTFWVKKIALIFELFKGE